LIVPRVLASSNPGLELANAFGVFQTELVLADARRDFVDALIAAIAERLNITRVLTLDRRDFQLIRPKHCPGFE
jgi:predicted nucleic acid-binding protein